VKRSEEWNLQVVLDDAAAPWCGVARGGAGVTRGCCVMLTETEIPRRSGYLLTDLLYLFSDSRCVCGEPPQMERARVKYGCVSGDPVGGEEVSLCQGL